MTSSLRHLLAQYRAASKSEREKGTYFERLALAFLKNDPGMVQEYEDAWMFGDWAKTHRLDGRDIGVDLVAKIRGEDSFCAVQCKFYAEGYRIQKGDIDSFLSSSQTRHFSRGLIFDTTGTPWSVNAEALLEELSTTRIGLDRLEESPIDWAAWFQRDEIKIAAPKELRPHQRDALAAVQGGLAEDDRGKLIMACGTGKTFTGLKIAEAMAGPGKTVLVLVPSLALMSQTIREWTIDAGIPLRSYAVCSDSQVGKRRRDRDDVAEVDLHDLDYPATTNAARLAGRASHPASDRMTVVFSTYQSIQVISDAQKLNGFPEFDLIICDEAHRTTGATLAGEDESNFVKIHSQSFIAGKKRLYMTATPRVFGDAVKSKAGEVDAVLASMDDPALYGETLFTRGFGWAVENGLLTDYKVLVLAVDEAMVSGGVQNRLTERLGIVYTPVQVVDFILHSVNEVLQSEFGQTLGSKGVHILDPFTGTGTFVTRLLQSGLIKPEELEHKYRHEIHANEIVLLAYYIAAINIEAAYHSAVVGDYPGMVKILAPFSE